MDARAWDEEAIEERRPDFTLPIIDGDATTVVRRQPRPLSWWERQVWRRMVRRRPALAGLHWNKE